MTIVITSCTNRKRKPVARARHISDLSKASITDLAHSWGRRLEAADEHFPAASVYGGRAFQEASTAARTLEARLLVVSAGLGLIGATDTIPPYACTVVVGAADSVAMRVSGPYEIAAWWRALGTASPFARPLADFVTGDKEPILAALSDAYLTMIADELLALPDPARERLRIFTRTPTSRVEPALRPYVMPYDDRLDGPDSPVRGTRSDFAGRALRHFAGLEIVGSVATDAAAVTAAIGGWRWPAKHDRARHDDAALLDLIRKHWMSVGGSSSRLLRLFRDDLGIACEQSRFAALARQVREERA